MNLLARLSRGAARRLCTWPFGIVSPTVQAQTLETLTERMTVSTITPGGPIQFYAPTPLLRSRAASVLSKEPDTIRWIDRFRDGAVFWDIGANVGVYSLYAAVNRKVSVLAFEPSAANFHVLSRNVTLNALSGSVAAYCVALSGETRLGVLNVDSPAMGSAINQFGEVGEISPYSLGTSARSVHGMIGFTIDGFIDRFGARFPNYIKIDVDGIELEILEGALLTLADPRLTSILVELSLTDHVQNERATAVLERAGFRLVTRGAIQGTETEKAANHLFDRHSCKVDGPANRCEAVYEVQSL